MTYWLTKFSKTTVSITAKLESNIARAVGLYQITVQIALIDTGNIICSQSNRFQFPLFKSSQLKLPF